MKKRMRGTEEHRIWLFDLAHGNLKDEQILQGFTKYYVLEGYVMANVVDDMRFHTHYSMDQIRQSKENLERVIWVTAEPERVRKARIMEAKLRGYMDELETGSMWDCKQIYDWMFGAIDFSRRIGLIEGQVENVLKEELERRFEDMREKLREAQG